MKCHECGFEIIMEIGKKIFRQDTCPNCDSYLRCCLNCKLYDPVAWKECHEPQALRVNDKTMANFCEYFIPADDNVVSGTSRSQNARDRLNELFGKKES